MITSRIIVLITLTVLQFDLCCSPCAPSEYEIGGQCCPMCAPGNRVYGHCTEDSSTTCAPCPEHTYIDEPSGLTKCFVCTVCDSSQGLRVGKACVRWSDTVCDPLDHFYCIERNKASCRFAVKHSECSPGQYIKQAGTASSDTVCADCEDGTYSDGSFSSCSPHTQCEALGLTETKAGTTSSDRECGENTTAPTAIALSVIVTVIIIIAVVIFAGIRMRKRSGSAGGCVNAELHRSVEEEVKLRTISIPEGTSELPPHQRNNQMN